LPIISPHGHTDSRWFADNEPFPEPAQLFVVPDHYVFRMLYSQGVPLEQLGIRSTSLEDPKRVWRIFAQHYSLFRGTPTRLWLDFAFQELFGLEARLTPANADEYYDSIVEKLRTPAFLPRSLFERFRLEVLATTDSPLDSLAHHETIRASVFKGRIIPTFRPDPVVDPDFPEFKENLARLAQMTAADIGNWRGYLSALRQRRLEFKALGCTATDHGHPTAATADLSSDSAARLFHKVASGSGDRDERELFRAQMLTEMAAMSLDDGLVMQIHPGSLRDHNKRLFPRFGRDVGADIPTPTNYVQALRPLLDRFGNEPRLTIILFTLDESTYSRELAPLAGHYPCLRLGPAWWFHDSPEGMMRFREYTTETAGFYNMVGFNDDSRAFLSIPARHDVARRIDCSFLARLVAEHRIDEDEAHEIAAELAYGLARKAYRL
jgi:glucuronate isomerase